MTDPEIYLRRSLVSVARSWVGITELGGNNKGQMVERFQRAVDQKASGEPWCMAFVQFCMIESRRLCEDIFAQSFNVSDKIFKTEHCLTAWNRTDKFQRIEKPIPGALIFWQKYRHDIGTTSGHVGIVSKILDDDTVLTIEGNTNDGSGVVRDGDGVYELTRFYKMRQGSLRFVGFIDPW